MSTLVIGKPNAKQDLFLRDTHMYVGYGGARGGGKSWAIRTKAKLLCMRYPGIRVLIVRRTYPELERNHISQLRKELVPEGFARYNKQQKMFNFKNSSTIECMYCRQDSDLEGLQGAEYDVIFIDEATNLSEYQLKAIAACCRGVNKFPKRVYYTCNPGGQGHGYIKRVFIDRNFEKGENPDDYSFIQALVYDNEILLKSDPAYLARLEALPAKIREAWLNGSWDMFQGQFFEEFVNDPDHYDDHVGTHVINPFRIPRDWKVFRSYDFGYSKPFSVGWWAVDYDGRYYRILELYGCTGIPNEGVKWTPAEQAEKVREIEKQHPLLKGRRITGVADPAIWNSETGESVADTFASKQIYFDPGDHQRINGWMQVHYRLQFDENGIPMMYVFNTCKEFIRTIPLMMYDETKVEDLDTDLEDHIADETRYACMAHQIKPRRKETKLELEDDPLNLRPKKAPRYARI